MTTIDNAATTAITDATARVELANRLIGSLKRRGAAALGAQQSMLELLRPMAEWSKADIREDEALKAVFEVELLGDDLSRMAQWISGHTPILIKWDEKTGRFAGLSVSPKRAKAAKNDPLAPPVWDFKGLETTSWVSYNPENRKKKGKPDMQRGADALVREAARAMEIDLMTVSAVREFVDSLAKDFMSKVIEERDTERHEKWSADYRRDHNLR